MTNETLPIPTQTPADELAGYRSPDGRGHLCVMDRTGDTKL